MEIDRIRGSGRQNRASEATKQKIIQAADRLFSRYGIDGVSFRQIASFADLKNTNAVRYHFGTREQLVRAVFEYYSARFDPLRAEMLTLAESKERTQDTKTLLEILMLPYLSIFDDDGQHSYAGFMAQYMMMARPEAFNFPYDDTGPAVPALRKVLSLLKERAIYLPDDILQHRIRGAIRMFSSAVVRWDNDRNAKTATMSLAELVNDTISQVAAAFGAPYRYSEQDLFASLAAHGATPASSDKGGISAINIRSGRYD